MSPSHLTKMFALAVGALFLSSTGCASGDDPAPDEASQEGAFSAPSPSDFPTDSGWALGMISKACEIPSSSLEGAQGSIARTSDGVVYSATRSGEVIASAWAESTFIAARKRCLTK